jgi:hypothetical protein
MRFFPMRRPKATITWAWPETIWWACGSLIQRLTALEYVHADGCVAAGRFGSSYSEAIAIRLKNFYDPAEL